MLPLKSKQGQELVLSTGRKPSKLQTDQSTEFLDRMFQTYLHDNNIDFFTVNSGLKASVVERFNRTIKNKMYKYFTAKNTLTYINVLSQLLSSYNNTYHRSIKMKPSEVTKANETKVWDTLYGNALKSVCVLNFKWEIVLGSDSEAKNLTCLISRTKCLLYTNEWRVKYPFTN